MTFFYCNCGSPLDFDGSVTSFSYPFNRRVLATDLLSRSSSAVHLLGRSSPIKGFACLQLIASIHTLLLFFLLLQFEVFLNLCEGDSYSRSYPVFLLIPLRLGIKSNSIAVYLVRLFSESIRTSNYSLKIIASLISSWPKPEMA